jgi:Tol biopolymer transport system component
VSTDTNGCRDVFVHDLVSGSNTLVSVSAYGSYSGNGPSWEPAISGDGRYVAFASYATNLVVNDTNNAADVFFARPSGGIDHARQRGQQRLRRGQR